MKDQNSTEYAEKLRRAQLK